MNTTIKTWLLAVQCCPTVAGQLAARRVAGWICSPAPSSAVISTQEVNALSSPRPVGNTSVLCRVHTVLPAPLPRTRHMHAAWLLVTLVITSTHISTHIYTYLRCTLSTLTLTLTTLPPSYNIYTTHIYTAHIYKYLHCTYLHIYHNAQ